MQEIEQFLDYGSKTKGWTESTIHGRRYQLRRLVAWYAQSFGRDPTLSDLTYDICQMWVIAREKEKLSPSTRYSGVLAVRAFGAWAVEQGLIDCNPGKTLKLPRLYALTQKSCSETEKEALLDAAQHRLPKKEQPKAAAVLAVFVYAGLRRAEVLALNVEDLNWHTDARRSKLIVLHGKGDKRREIPINSDLGEHLKAWLTVRLAPLSEKALFIGQSGHRLSDYLLGQLLEDVKTAAGMQDRDNLTPHGFRHYFATELDRRGVPLPEISELLGHSELAVTLSYLQCDKSRLFDAVEKLVNAPKPGPVPERRENERSRRPHAKWRR